MITKLKFTKRSTNLENRGKEVKTMKKIFEFKKCLIVAIVCLTATLVMGLDKVNATTTMDASPARITFDGNGQLLVTDYTFGQVLTVAPDTLDIISEININGSPLGVACADDLVYVGNSTTGQVEVYNSYGQQQFILGYGNHPIAIPQDIAIGNGNVYVVDGAEKVIKVFGKDGIYVGSIPENGFNRNILANPTAIAVDESNGHIYVSDYGDLGSNTTINPRIQIFDVDGNIHTTINSGEPNKYRFTMPQGLTVNGNNELYVIDSLTGEIHIFDADNGTLLSKVKGSGIDAGVFAVKMPLDLVIDNVTKNVFVTNNLMASIKVFDGAGGI